MVSANTLIAFIIYFVEMLGTLLFWAIFIHVILSWFAQGRTPLGMMLEQIVRPMFRLFRWARIGMIDFSPIVALIAINIIAKYLVQFLTGFLT